MQQAQVGQQIRILVDERGAPVGTVVQVTGVDEDGLNYRWEEPNSSYTYTFGVSHNNDETKFYEICDANYELELLKNIAEQFVVLYEEGNLTSSYPGKENLEYLHSAFKDALEG